MFKELTYSEIIKKEGKRDEWMNEGDQTKDERGKKTDILKAEGENSKKEEKEVKKIEVTD